MGQFQITRFESSETLSRRWVIILRLYPQSPRHFARQHSTGVLQALLSVYQSHTLHLRLKQTNTRNKTTRLFRQEHKNSILYWYLTIETCFDLSLDHFQANVRRQKVKSVRNFAYTL